MSKNKSKNNDNIEIPKLLLTIAKFLSVISTKLTVLFAAKLFTTPVKYKIPKRELEMYSKSDHELLYIPSINKKIMVYSYGTSAKKILLVHGWSGRGTQLFKIADELLKSGYSTISFDAPAHGKSPGRNTLMPEFIETILELEQQLGPFEVAIGHSLGGMSLLNSLKRGLKINRLILIGSGDIVKDIIDDFVKKLNLEPEISDLLQYHFEKKSGLIMDDFSAYKVAKDITIPVLVIHDENDSEVPVKCAIHIHKHLINSELLLTQNLGHRKILGDKKVIEKIIHFINLQ
jgi:pimeloyl-ACP methyl ester carboxylesterase